MRCATLEIRWRTREEGGGRTDRRYLDFVVDGVSLHEMLGSPDLIGGMGWGEAEGEREYINRLLLESPPDAPSGRTSLYVCPECGDIGCGAITARISESADSFVWSEC